MSNKGGRVSPDYLADIAPEYAYYSYLISEIDKIKKQYSIDT